jgi:hypothetical protein
MTLPAILVLVGFVLACIFSVRCAYQNLFPERAYTEEEWKRANLLLQIVKQDPNARAEMKRNKLGGCIWILTAVSFGAALLFYLYVFLFYRP